MAVKHVAWTCPTCSKSMASEGGFKIHLSQHHETTPLHVDMPSPAVTASAPSPDSPLPARSERARRLAGGIWDVKIEAEGAGESISPADADAFLAALRDEGARVSTTFHPDKRVHYAVTLTVHADGVLTAVLRGTSHFQAAVQAVRLPALRVVGIDARESAATADA